MITTAGEVAQDSSDHTFADDSPSLPSSSVPSSSVSSSLSSSSPPQYTLNREFCTVTDVWREYDHGVVGNPSVRSLEEYPAPYFEVEKGLFLLYHLVSGVSGDGIEKYLPQ
ncbi:hypothetical protein INT45_006538, partial [Circinella minor]